MWRRRREPWEELSFLLNSLSPRNWFIRRWGLMAGRGQHLCWLRCACDGP
ncbi:uncharacterized protein YLR154C-G [Saccharomyces cerevisiae S288C]|uniref:Uncharacterized protein YLR154C-G n=4 Tax=Saccharomyces cerevisiae TaxID=4932 RepID=YL154_YEAST|nr:uncharacterized protein YLR154C-G [Saccharomyces cerevisiae S288C]Q3E813.1 RecName: Full=Uncharacterized protein YLR154C-G [Saccharomyces cerevisiae S288C]EEU04590.1 YLR154C-G-like protein [Saccharomyces cerevisiae JAY291]KAG2505444.1 uncharacterized protein INSC1020_20050 [Saccharomyces cerevisiae]WNV72857.1 hypothetical protein O6U65_1717 [Saccharomyces cerevisiae synthetic construct]CAE6508778.1 hypothetical protein EO220_3919 [Saccharomyces cerevisiae PE-2]CAY81396.1 EC1118_1L10_2542p |eukprot:NP_878121.1 hypothetical protein YLR154C-G [Saccharomyces cerevisiae S288C]